MEYVRNAARRNYSGDQGSTKQMQPVLLEKMFLVDGMEVLNLDDFPGVTNAFLHTVGSRLDPEVLTSISIVNNQRITGRPVASLLQGCVNLKRLNLKGCIKVKNEAFPDSAVKKLKGLEYINVSFTQVGPKVLASLYRHCPKLATFKLANCKFGRDIKLIFPQPSENLTSLKLRHCALSPGQLEYILEIFPNLQTLDYSSSTAPTFRSIRALINIQHPSQLRKLNLSNCPYLSLTKPAELKSLFTIHSKLEHIYLTDVKIDLNTIIPENSFGNFKTIFMPEVSLATRILPTILKLAHNLTYLDLSRTDLTFHQRDYPEPLILNVPNLRTLSLEGTKVTDQSAELISQLHTLRSLFLRSTVVSAEGMRVIIYACPWLDEVDLTGCRRIDLHQRRTLLPTLRNEFWESLAKARDTGEFLTDWDEMYKIQTFYNGYEERDGLVKVEPTRQW
jgi:Leucine-rich repeat (LRR) protein